jgi:hypothetical protein
MGRSLRNLLRQTAGFTGAERALVVCFGLAIVLLCGHLLTRGSEQGAGDARRALVENPLSGGKLGAVARPLSAGRVGEAGRVAETGEVSAAVKDLRSRFDIVADDFAGERRPNQLTQAEYDRVERLFNDVRDGKTHLRFGGKDLAADPNFRDLVMRDIATILQTASGRALIDKLANNPNGNTVTITVHRDAAGRPDTSNAFADAANPAERSKWGNGKGVHAIMAYVPGRGVEIPGGSSQWLPLRVDVVLFHEMVHALHMTRGTMDDSLVQPGPGVSNGDVSAGIRNSEYQAVGLGRYAKDPITENRYRTERRRIGDGLGGLPGDSTMNQRDEYIVRTSPRPAPAPQPAPQPPRPAPRPAPLPPSPAPQPIPMPQAPPIPWVPAPQPIPWVPAPQPIPWVPAPQPIPWVPAPQPMPVPQTPWLPLPQPMPAPWPIGF